jgi:hypothetical protein
LDLYQWNTNWLQRFQVFDISTLLAHDIGVEALKFNQVCDGPNMTRIPYGQCQNSELYEDAAVDYSALVKKQAGTVIPASAALVWRGLSHEHSIGNTLPSWSMHKRQDREVFGSWIFNQGDRCQDGHAGNSICHMGQSKATVTPWVGGDFNPFQMCDIVAQGDVADGEQDLISCSCTELICQNSGADYFANQPSTMCQKYSGDNTRSRWSNVPRHVTQYQANTDTANALHFSVQPATDTMYDNNLCVHQPLVPRTCKHAQGMLGGRPGTTMQMPVSDIYTEVTSKRDLYQDMTPKYTDSTLHAAGMGLFINGGNAIYRVQKTAQVRTVSHYLSVYNCLIIVANW